MNRKWASNKDGSRSSNWGDARSIIDEEVKKQVNKK